MKKYCLTNKAQNQLKGIAGFILLLIVGFIATLIVLSALFFFFDTIAGSHERTINDLGIYAFYFGAIFWIVITSFSLLGIYKWLKMSIKEC